MNDISESFLEVTLKDTESFLKIKETLTRIGVAAKDENKLYQSCHILHKKSRYYIVHFKQMFELDGKETNFDENDQARLNRIALLLEEWGLLDINTPDAFKEPMSAMNQIKVIRHAEKGEWELIPKYNIGVRKFPDKDTPWGDETTN